ncbi:MAG: DNA-directed DNA polymerase II small subunit [Theionarchaea archaeon]|nr:DNA-directed DNA polymerase II small subunit [Theionarchaea archaeon]
MIESSSSIELINEKFNKNQLFLTTSSAQSLVHQDRLDEFIQYLKTHNIVFVQKDHIDSFFYPQVDDENPLHYKKEKLPLDNFVRATRPEIEHDFRILRDITRDAVSEGNCKDFVNLFQSRFEKLSRMFRVKPSMRDFQPISIVKKMKPRDHVKTVGIISEYYHTRNGNILMTIEDEKDSIKALIHHRNEHMMALAQMLLEDEVIGITGVLGQDIIFIDQVEFPDIPVGRTLNSSTEDICVAITSDLHVGSKDFLEAAFLRFIRWLNLKYSRKAELASKIQYLLVAGDLIDGAGIYPGQENDLDITDMKEQYVKLTQLLKLIPSHIHIILIPGNHDATRLGEPQLPVLEEYAPDLYSMENVEMAGNPCFIDIHSVKFLLYHGGSLFDFLAKQTQHDDASRPMIEMLKKRHLTPLYGNVPIVPLEEDLMVIEDIPDVFVTGHIHVNSHGNYRGTTVLNAGCWMRQSDYQKTRNINPTPCKVPVFNLKTHHTTVMNFGTQ